MNLKGLFSEFMFFIFIFLWISKSCIDCYMPEIAMYWGSSVH